MFCKRTQTIDRNDETLGRVVMLQHEIIVTRPLLQNLLSCNISGYVSAREGRWGEVIQLSTNMYTLYLK